MHVGHSLLDVEKWAHLRAGSFEGLVHHTQGVEGRFFFCFLFFVFCFLLGSCCISRGGNGRFRSHEVFSMSTLLRHVLYLVLLLRYEDEACEDSLFVSDPGAWFVGQCEGSSLLFFVVAPFRPPFSCLSFKDF